MTTLAGRVLRAAEGEVGTVESGDNTGARVRQYQASTPLDGSGWPWCAAFVSFCWQAGGVPRSVTDRIASPSTGIMCDLARADGLVMSPRPGAAVVWCGVHVELLHTPLGPGVWRTIGGNTEDGVRYRTRSLSGALVFGPAGLEDEPPKPVALYWLEDPNAEYRVMGPWAELEWARRMFRDLSPSVRARARVVATGKGAFAIRIGDPRHYGPWSGPAGKTIRDKRARPALERRLGRRLRPYRTARAPGPPSRAAVEALGKTH